MRKPWRAVSNGIGRQNTLRTNGSFTPYDSASGRRTRRNAIRVPVSVGTGYRLIVKVKSIAIDDLQVKPIASGK